MGLPARQPLTMALLSRRMGVEVEAPVVEVEAHGGQAGATRGVEAVCRGCAQFDGTFGSFSCVLPLVVCRVSLVASQRW